LCFKNKFLPLRCYNINPFVMAKYISSVVVTLFPKRECSSESIVSKVLELDYVTGSTIPHATHFINKSPLIKSYLSKYDIVSLTFKYSEL
jgi:hypothetical protein